MPIDNAIKVFHKLQNVSNEDDLKECEHKEPNVLPIWLFIPIFAVAIAAGAIFNKMLLACLVYIILLFVSSFIYYYVVKGKV